MKLSKLHVNRQISPSQGSSFVWTAVIFVISLVVSSCRPTHCAVAPALDQRVSAIRGLSFTAPVPCELATAPEVEARLDRSVSSSNQGEWIAVEERLFRTLGFLDEDESYDDFLERHFRTEIGGFYSPQTREIVLERSLRGERGDEIILHELTHALQDQHYGLSRFTLEHVTTDCAIARLAAVEGDANRIMRLGTGSDPCERSEAWGIQVDSEEALFSERASRHSALLRLFSFPYRYGTALACRAFNERGVNGLNDLIKNPPSSTREILHEQTVTFGSCPVRLNAYAPESLGEFGVFSLLSSWVSLSQAKDAAEGLKHDELVWEGSTLRWTLSFGSRAQAREFYAILMQSQATRFQVAPVEKPNSFSLQGYLFLSAVLTNENVEMVYQPRVIPEQG